MTITQKYNFKVSVNQFHTPVNEYFEDDQETALIEIFEKCVLDLKQLNKEKYSMVELGSNQCYYSLLFKHILGKDKTLNIMVEPSEKNYNVGVGEFKLNECEGIFYKAGISDGKNILMGGGGGGFIGEFNVPSITLAELFDKHAIDVLDVLQCDIDGSERFLLSEHYDIFKQQKIKNIFLSTHSTEIHDFCRQQLLSCDYKIVLDITDGSVGWDNLIVCSL
jgi:hypothetical protein